MVSSSPQDGTNKNLKYKLKEPVIRFTYHSSHVPFAWRRMRPMVKMNQRLLCFISVARKSPSSSVTSVHEKRFVDSKIAVNDMKRVLFSSL